MFAIIVLWKVFRGLMKYVRKVASIHDHNQHYFAIPDQNLSFLKKNILYAPTWPSQGRVFKLGSVNAGVVPSRIELFFLTTYFLINVVFSLLYIPFRSSAPDAMIQLRNRTGCLAVVNMVNSYSVVITF